MCLIERKLVSSLNVEVQHYVPTVFDNFSANVVFNGSTVNLGLWIVQVVFNDDDPFTIIIIIVLDLSYRGADVIIIAFSLISKASYENVSNKWIPELEHYAPGVPFVLVGTKLAWCCFYYHCSDMNSFIYLGLVGQDHVIIICLLCVKGRAAQENVKGVFVAAIRVVLQPPKQKKKKSKKHKKPSPFCRF
ncbi:hypothetical protein N665_0330s0006 [Sinapis alba]|nr:hypothetical protein N665_0330s0006 [Sinapis alba]